MKRVETSVKNRLWRLFGVTLISAFGVGDAKLGETEQLLSGVYAGFNLNHPETGPFPADVFTVEDATENTGRRLDYPMPDCSVRPDDCNDISIMNGLDGWAGQPQVSVVFSDEVNTSTLNSNTVFLISLDSTLPGEPPGGELIGINQLVWEPTTHTLYAETDAALNQHRKYGLVVTNGVTDLNGCPIRATSDFLNMTNVPPWYAARLQEVLDAAASLGIPPSSIVTASAFTTQTLTSVLERIRDTIHQSTPAPADFNLLGPYAQRTVFDCNAVASATWLPQTTVSPPGYSPMALPLEALDVVPGAVGTMAYGRYRSPQYVIRPDIYIPAVGTLADVPPIQNCETVYFTLFLPAGTKPTNGWPIVVLAGGTSSYKHFDPMYLGAKLAEHGFAAIEINQVGQGFGPLTRLQLTMTDGSTVTFPDAGRGIDQDGDNMIDATEGAQAAPPRLWTLGARDSITQSVIDYLQLTRVIQVGMDVTGTGIPDIDPSKIYFAGASQGGFLGTMLLSLEPAIPVGICSAVPGVIPEHLRWQPNRRSDMGLQLQARTPSLINPNGLTSIDGVPVGMPYFNENKPLRDQPIVINNVAGAIDIQRVLEFAKTTRQSGLAPALWARYVRRDPLPGSYAKSVIFIFSKGDRRAVNPGNTLLLRTGDLADTTIYLRTDLAVAQDPGFPHDPHTFLINTIDPNPLARTVALGGQEAMGVFFESDGTIISHPAPANLFEVPISTPLPETLNFIP